MREHYISDNARFPSFTLHLVMFTISEDLVLHSPSLATPIFGAAKLILTIEPQLNNDMCAYNPIFATSAILL
jgi:hypothetical protein